jgi:hypothetical protein
MKKYQVCLMLMQGAWRARTGFFAGRPLNSSTGRSGASLQPTRESGMAEPKTKVNEASVAAFVDAIADAQVREDCRVIVEIMQAASKAKPKMWGAGIVGFGEHSQVYASGKVADWMLIGFSPRKQNIALYLMLGSGQNDDLLAELGKHTRGKGCLYIKRLSDIHLPTLKKLVRACVQQREKTSAPAC